MHCKVKKSERKKRKRKHIFPTGTPAKQHHIAYALEVTNNSPIVRTIFCHLHKSANESALQVHIYIYARIAIRISSPETCYEFFPSSSFLLLFVTCYLCMLHARRGTDWETNTHLVHQHTSFSPVRVVARPQRTKHATRNAHAICFRGGRCICKKHAKHAQHIYVYICVCIDKTTHIQRAKGMIAWACSRMRRRRRRRRLACIACRCRCT